jgi:DNA polymerase
VAGSFLWCLLPSGRVICYPYPKLLADEYGEKLTYMTVPGPGDEIIHDSKNASNWARVSTYGGSLFNNIVQGFCRDFLTDCMLDLDAAGAQIVLHTYDDINIEVDEAKGEGARAEMQRRMCAAPAWAAGFPLKAGVKLMKRYGK